MNRCFSEAQKRHLYIAHDGLCARCMGDLGEDWEAHHVTRWADGGLTELTNAAALCRRCHFAVHRGDHMKPRGWQEEAFEKFIASDGKSFLVEATPGAGKTIFSAFCADYLLKNGACDFVVCVVPTTALKGDELAGFLGDYNKVGPQITTVLRDKKPAPREFSGGVVTYSQLPNIVGTFETWRRQGKRLFFVFDEIHHASESNVWGSATERCGAIAERILAMTGTPFRGDGQRISFVRYNGSGEVVADYAYAYRQAVADDVCRPVLFVHDDGTASYIFEEKEEVEISKARDDQVGKVQGTIFRRGSEFLTGVLSKADAKLDEYRLTAPSAGGIIICRPGINDDDDRHVLEVAKALQELTGEVPTVITHDDKDANAKIDRFRRSQDRWIVSVRKVSEGVDIKRLRVMVLATHPGTELLFRQLVGRVVRVIDKTANEDSTVYMAKFPRLVEFASRIEDEAQQGLKLKKSRGLYS